MSPATPEPSTDAAPSDLPDLAAVRRSIDELDERLVGLLVARQHLVARAGDFKADDAAVRAPARAAAVVERAARRAEEAGGSGALVRRIYTAMVESYIEFEGGVSRRRPR